MPMNLGHTSRQPQPTFREGLKARHSPAWGEAPGFRPTDEPSPEGAKPPSRHIRAFTMTELAIVVLAVAVLALLLLPWMRQARTKSRRVLCMSNQHQVSSAQRNFGDFHTNPVTGAESFTMGISTNYGGTLEFVGTGNAAAHYQNIATELGSAKVLVCPEDSGRTMRSDFLIPLSNSNVSYAVGLDADELQPNTILISDNHMISSLPRVGAIIELSVSNTVVWTSKLHDGIGNIGFVDGSVQQITSTGLLIQVTLLTSAPTNRHRLEFP